MQYVCYEPEEEDDSYWHQRLLIKIDTRLQKRRNPDFYLTYGDVVYWWLELNQDSIPVRELGFDRDGSSIVAGPYDRNSGLFTSVRPKVKGFYPIEMYLFAEQWDEFGKHSSTRT